MASLYCFFSENRSPLLRYSCLAFCGSTEQADSSPTPSTSMHRERVTRIIRLCFSRRQIFTEEGKHDIGKVHRVALGAKHRVGFSLRDGRDHSDERGVRAVQSNRVIDAVG